MKGLSLFITLAILVVVAIILKDIDFEEVYLLLKEIDLVYFILAFLASGVSVVIWNFRWQNSLRILVNGGYWFLMEVLLAGIFVNTITPGAGVGGEPVRAYFLSKKYKKSKTKFFGCIIAEKVFNLIVFFAFLIFSSLFIFAFIDTTRQLRIILEVILVTILLISTLGGFIIWKKWEFKADWLIARLYKIKSIRKNFKNFENFRNYVAKRMDNLVTNFKAVLIDRNKFYFGIFASVGVWMALFFTSYFLFLSLDARVSFISVIIAVSFSHLIGDLSPSPGGIGTTEGTMFIIYSAMGISPPLAAVVALLSRIIYYFYALLLGGLSLMHLRHSVK